MKDKTDRAASTNVATNEHLRATWFQLLENLYQSITEKSDLECATRCSARCCPKSKASQNSSDAVGHVAIMLPFEMEYIASKTNAPAERLQQERIQFTHDTYLDIGFTTSSTPCPFLSDDNRCGIYDIRPLDCRSFPLIPAFDLEGDIGFRVDGECPSAITFSNANQMQLKAIWKELLPNLPMSYRIAYNQL